MRIVRLVTAAVTAAALAVIGTGGPALAHNSLTKAVPDKNATVRKPPASVQLSFLQKVDPEKLTIEVVDAQQQKVPSGRPEADGKMGLLALTGTLANGTYTVRYSVVSEDGHPVKGSYKFTVDAPVAAAPSPSSTTPSPSPSPSVAPTTDAPATVAAADTSSSSGPSAGLIIGIAALALVLVGGAIFVVRRRRTSAPL
ncbi:copper resistance CopC family protein [Actinoplanes sp. NPDC051470]|uniref:copper resistance CopC family protein n=1 Tax=Actinoplanes sp. NPDC051470 TaxID=3157224 RepID=UPI00341B0D61